MYRVTLKHYQWLKQLAKLNSIQGHNFCSETAHKLFLDKRVQILTARYLCNLHHDHTATSVLTVVDKWTQTFAQEGIPEPKESAGLIVAHVLGKKMIGEVDKTLSITAEQSLLIKDMCEKRLKRCPVQYIIGEWDFQDMTLHMEPPVLIPRTETEELADYIVDALRSLQYPQPIRVLDIGCGSGALSLYLLKQLFNANCVAVDINKTACQLTIKNARKYRLLDRLQVVHGDVKNGKCTLQQLQPLPGLFNFAWSWVVPNQAFLRRLWDKRVDAQALHLYTDAASTTGCAAVFGSEWFAEAWKPSFKVYNINVLELIPTVIALEIWGHKMSDRKIIFHSDNIVSVSAINELTSKDPIMMCWVHKLVLLSKQHNIMFKAEYIAACRNTLADNLSRLKIQTAFSMVSKLKRQPIHVPDHVWTH